VFSRALTSRVLYDMIGVPKADQDKMNGWVYAVLSVFPGRYWEHPTFAEYENYLHELIALRRAEPRDDLLSALITASGFTDRELSQHMYQLVVAGHESTAGLIANLVHQLLSGDRADWLSVGANHALLGGAMAESLRHRAPLTWISRTAREDAVLDGQMLPSGEKVFIGLESANRDEAVFDNAEEFVLGRHNSRRHLSFGSGIHRCLGEYLALLETQVAVTELLDRYPELELAEKEYDPVSDILLRSPRRVETLLPDRVLPAAEHEGSPGE
jgi:cytochrome P450